MNLYRVIAFEDLDPGTISPEAFLAFVRVSWAKGQNFGAAIRIPWVKRGLYYYGRDGKRDAGWPQDLVFGFKLRFGLAYVLGKALRIKPKWPGLICYVTPSMYY